MGPLPTTRYATSASPTSTYRVSDISPGDIGPPVNVESPAPAGVGAYGPAGMPTTAAVYTPNEATGSPPPALGEGPLWPSTVSPYPQPADGSTLTREAMYAGLTPGTAEDLPRRTPPKPPTAAGPEPAPDAAPHAAAGMVVELTVR